MQLPWWASARTSGQLLFFYYCLFCMLAVYQKKNHYNLKWEGEPRPLRDPFILALSTVEGSHSLSSQSLHVVRET
jgi:hypothetical protein